MDFSCLKFLIGYNTIKSCRFDQIYHEHVSYFTVKMAFNLLKEVGLEIVKLQIVNYHGGSIRVFAKKKTNPNLSNKIKYLINKETEWICLNRVN